MPWHVPECPTRSPDCQAVCSARCPEGQERKREEKSTDVFTWTWPLFSCPGSGLAGPLHSTCTEGMSGHPSRPPGASYAHKHAHGRLPSPGGVSHPPPSLSTQPPEELSQIYIWSWSVPSLPGASLPHPAPRPPGRTCPDRLAALCLPHTPTPRTSRRDHVQRRAP